MRARAERIGATDAQMDATMGNLLLIDGSSFFWRAFHVYADRRRADGMPVNAVEGLLSMTVKPIIERNAASHVAVVFDASGPTFRHALHPGYKANRPPPPEDLVAQKPLVGEAVRAYGLPYVTMAGCEADDVIATLTRQAVEAGHTVYIATPDKDLMQLVRPGVALFNHKTKTIVREAQVEEKFGVRPERVVDVQALMGDASDNIPGVPRIGLKTAAELIQRYGDLEGVLAAANGEEIKQKARREALIQHAEDARLSYRLAQLKDDVALEVALDDLAITAPPPDMRDYLASQGLPLSLVPRMSRRFPEWRLEERVVEPA